MNSPASRLCLRAVAFAIGFMLAVAAIVGCAKLFGAQDREQASPIRVVAITLEPQVEMNGSITSIAGRAYIQRVEIMPSGEVVTTNIGSVQFDLMNKSESVRASGNKRTYADIGAAVYAVALQEWRETTSAPDPHQPTPLPDERKTRRQP